MLVFLDMVILMRYEVFWLVYVGIPSSKALLRALAE